MDDKPRKSIREMLPEVCWQLHRQIDEIEDRMLKKFLDSMRYAKKEGWSAIMTCTKCKREIGLVEEGLIYTVFGENAEHLCMHCQEKPWEEIGSDDITREEEK